MTTGVLMLAGPTGAGKTALAVRIAQRFGAEIVGADSRQIYRGMSIGTAAPSAAERAAVPHHLIGFLDPAERYSAARFAAQAMVAIDAIHARGGRSLVVGGTGFYLRVLAGGVALSPLRDEVLRARLAREAKAHPPPVLHAWLTALDPERALTVGSTDTYRVTRALEVALARRDVRTADGEPPQEANSLRARGIPLRKTYLAIDVATLHARIAARVDAMLAAGFLAEAQRIGSDAVAADAVGYRDAWAYLDGWASAAELRANLARATRRYAKRQATWFRSEPDLEQLPFETAFDALASIARELPGWS